MNSATLLRSGATIALIANAAIGILFPDHNSLTAPLQPLYVPLNLASVIAVTLLLFGLHGWYNRHAAALGRRGAVGTVLIVLTLLLVGVFIGLYLPIVIPLAAQEAPVFIAPGPALLVPVLLLGVLAEIAGPLLLGWDLLRRSIGSRWAAWTLLVSSPVTLVWIVSVLLDADGAASPLTIVTNILSAALLFIAFAGFGTETTSEGIERPTAVAVRSAA
jgi:hypothetical protein